MVLQERSQQSFNGEIKVNIWEETFPADTDWLIVADFRSGQRPATWWLPSLLTGGKVLHFQIVNYNLN